MVSRFFRFMSLSFVQPARWLRRMTPLVNREKPITDRKKTTSRESTVPLVNDSKWVITLNEETRSTSHGLSMRVSTSVTGGNPQSTRNRQITTEMMKLTTWLRVMAEVMQLIDKYVPAINRLPKYDVIMTPLSGEQIGRAHV